ncbi:MAG: hypothetical protein LBQ48_06660 [Oscillospiraceae bacterium]|jgi:hypothetical protein|nr:hypothetical protein [Oscillospiraceae bacterium]
MEKKQIVRGLTLINRNEYEVGKRIQKAQYIAMGAHDAIRVSDTIINSERGGEGSQGNEDSFYYEKGQKRLSRCWFHDVDNCVMLKNPDDSKNTGEDYAGISFETVFIFRTEEESETNKDENFWSGISYFNNQADGIGENPETDCDLPWLFVTFLQTDKFVKDNVGLRKNAESALLGRIGGQKDVKVILYSTTDTADLVLLTRCLTYEAGARIVEVFSNTVCEISGNPDKQKECRCAFNIGYSIPAVHTQWVKKSLLSGKREVKPEATRKRNDNLNIEVRYSCDSRITNYENKIKGIFTGGEVFNAIGNDDYVFKAAAAEANLVGFLGFMNRIIPDDQNSSDWNNYFKGLSYVSTHVLTKTGLPEHGQPLSVVCPGNCECSYISDDYLKNFGETCGKILEYISFLQKKHSETDIEYQTDTGKKIGTLSFGRAIAQLLNSLGKFEKEPFAQRLTYEYALIAQPIASMLKYAGLYGDGSDSEESITPQNLIHYQEEFKDFIRHAAATVQNGVRSQKQYFSNHDIQLGVSDMSPKLMCADRAFLLNFKKLMDVFSDNHTYDFLFYPSADNSVVREKLVFGENREHHLSYIKIETRYEYDMRNLIFLLLHEVSHVLSPKLRNRQKRQAIATEILTEFVCRQWSAHYVERIRNEAPVEFKIPEIEKVAVESAKSVCPELNKEIDRIKKDWINERLKERQGEKKEELTLQDMQKYSEYYDKYCQHSAHLKPILSEAISSASVSEKIYDAVKGNVFKETALYLGSLSKADKKKASDFLHSIFLSFPECNISIYDVVGCLFAVLAEVYSDILTILTLKLEPNQYFKTLTHDFYASGITTDYIDDTDFIRILLTTYCLKNSPPENFNWNHSEHRDFFEKEAEIKKTNWDSHRSQPRKDSFLNPESDNFQGMYTQFVKLSQSIGKYIQLNKGDENYAFGEKVKPKLFPGDYEIFGSGFAFGKVSEYINEVIQTFETEKNDSFQAKRCKIEQDYKVFYQLKDMDEFINKIYELNAGLLSN